MPNTIQYIAIAALTLILLAVPLAAGAQESGEQLDSQRIKFLEDNSWDTESVDQNARFAIYVEPEMDVMDETRFIEDNLPGESHGYVIDVFFPAQPQGEKDKPEGMSQSEWIQFLEYNLWEYELIADVAGEADLSKVATGLCEVIGTGCVDGEPIADIAGEADLPKAHTALCQGEGLMIPLERTFTDYAVDVYDYCRNAATVAGEADVENLQGEGWVDTVNRTLNPY